MIIPAHNEENTLPVLLDALDDGCIAPEQIIVAANGCTDRTADVARARNVRVTEIAVSSKVAALNAAERLTTVYPRIYVDADVVISGCHARLLARALQSGDVHLVGPRRELDMSLSSAAVRHYYRGSAVVSGYDEVPFAGSGVFALSRSGRERFAEFPPLMADDAFVRSHFHPDETREVVDTVSTVRPPSTVRALYRRQKRVREGNVQLDLLGYRRYRSTGYAETLKGIRSSVSGRQAPLGVAIFMAVNFTVRLRSGSSQSLRTGWLPDAQR